MIRLLARRRLALPPRRCSSWLEEEWVAMHDGIRLATLHIWPLDIGPAPTIVMRTADGRSGPRGRRLQLARLVAESGYHVVVQDVRGRHDSEGHFVPGENELRDGSRCLEWVAAQAWCDGRIGLLGKGYAGFAAWAALAGAPNAVGAMAVSACARDLYELIHPGGSLAFEAALSFAVHIGERARVPARDVDLERGLAFRPAREADRVALRQVDWYRDWLDHPRRDAFWHAIVPPLPEHAPPILQLVSWDDPALPAALADHRRLDARQAAEGVAPRIVIGRAQTARMQRGLFYKGRRSRLREAILHFDRHLDSAGGRGAAPERVCFFLSGAEVWSRSRTWPPGGAQIHTFHLRSRDPGPGLHTEAPLGAEPPDRYHHDPSHTRTERIGAGGTPRSGTREDGLTYFSVPLVRQLCAVGDVRVELHVASSAPDSDFRACLLDVDPHGACSEVCEGIVRCRWRGLDDSELQPRFLEAGEIVPLSIELGPVAHRFAPGHRIGLEISSCGRPRFDCNPGGREDPARTGAGEGQAAQQQIFHDAERPSRLLIPVLENL